jgi:hypothetical protein
MTNKEIEKLRKLFKESCISAWTSESFQIPALTKAEAEYRWLHLKFKIERK